MKTYPVEIVFQGHSIRTHVEARDPHEAIDIVLETVDVYVECDDDEWDNPHNVNGEHDPYFYGFQN